MTTCKSTTWLSARSDRVTAAAFAACAAIALGSAPALAQPGVDLAGTVELERTVIVDGKPTVELVKPSVVVPGNRLVFKTRYSNRSSQAVTDFVVNNRLPDAVTLDSISADVSTVSVDSGKSWGNLGTLKVSDGKGGLRPAVAQDVTNLRWVVARIAPGASGEVAYRAQVR